MGCPQCRACFIQFSFFQKYLERRKFEIFWHETQKPKNLSQHNCPQCKSRTGLYILNHKNQIEYCTPCQRIWIEKNILEELTKEKSYAESDIIITDQILGLNPNSDSPGIIFALFDPHTAMGLQAAEYATNKVTNRIVETSLFKKYPVFTFALVVTVVCAMAYCHIH